MGEADHGVAVFVHGMEYIVTEELDDVTIASFWPPRVAIKPIDTN